jgi:inner membrane protein
MTGTNPLAAAVKGRGSALKLFGIALLTLAMIVPLAMLAFLNDERKGRAAEASFSVAQGWGGPQTIAGPLLAVPWEAPERRDAAGNVLAAAMAGRLILLPKRLDAAIDADSDRRKRGIFDVTVYTASVRLTGAYDTPDLSAKLPAGAVLRWDQASLVLGLGDVRGLTGDLKVTLGGRDLTVFEPGSGTQSLAQGVRAGAGLATAPSSLAFDIAFSVRGLDRLSVVPAGETSEVSITSDWPHPSFDGAFLPGAPQISAVGFKADWSVSFLSRPFPQAWNDGDAGSLEAAAFGVTFYQPVDHYQLVERALKYAILFVGLSFLVFFLIETVAGARIHIVQYLLAGSAQVIFYLLLLALAEQTGFLPAYVAAASACSLLTGLYAWSITQRLMLGLAVLLGLSVLYGLLYTLLNEEDYALLTGAAASFAALALTMFLTRRTDWYGAQEAALTPLKAQPEKG